MVNALWITLIGMGLVFVAILFLWGLMALLVRLTAEKEEVETGEELAAAPEAETPIAEAIPSVEAERERKRRAAAAAVAVALSLQPVSRPAARPAGSLSAWQMVHRAGQSGRRAR